jgi:hypothetical protein
MRLVFDGALHILIVFQVLGNHALAETKKRD